MFRSGNIGKLALCIGIFLNPLLLALLLFPSNLLGQPPKVRLPDEAAGLDGIAKALISAFDQVDIVALGEAHQRKVDSDLRIAIVRHPGFAKKVRAIVVEFASTTEQAPLDAYIRGENVPPAQLAQVWNTTTQAANKVWDSPVYLDFLRAVRDVNSRLPAEEQIRVFGGDPGPGDYRSREVVAVSVVKKQVLEQHKKALVIYGAAHFYRTMPGDYLASMGEDIGITRMLEADYPGRTLAVIPIGGKSSVPTGMTVRVSPDYRKFDDALKTAVRPVLVPLDRLPFRDFTAEEFLGGQVMTCRGGCRSIFQDSGLTLGEMADAVVYVGGAAEVGTKVKPSQ